jgi:hypothetical protein
VPGPLLRPYFQLLAAEDPRVDDTRAVALLTAAVETSRSTGERFCEAEILRVRAERRAAASPDADDADYRAAVDLARLQGAKMLELRALTCWARRPTAPERVLQELGACMEEIAPGGPSRTLDLAREVLESG